jgi:hypothetical protein
MTIGEPIALAELLLPNNGVSLVLCMVGDILFVALPGGLDEDVVDVVVVVTVPGIRPLYVPVFCVRARSTS